MKKAFVLFISLFLITSLVYGQGKSNDSRRCERAASMLPSSGMNEGVQTSPVQLNGIPLQPLSSVITIAGAVDIGLASKWHLTTNGQPLHNIQVDPDNAQNIHVCMMAALNVKVTDTTTANFFPQRRVYYTFSSDGGATWKTPTPLADIRTGYPNMMLMKRAGVYVAVIAAHRSETPGSAGVITALYIEQGAPGTGQFKEIQADRTTYDDADRDIIWPAIALSKDGTKIYTIASAFNTPVTYIQFGTFTLNGAKTDATWSGWKKGPADLDNVSFASVGEYTIHVSPLGKIGVLWRNADNTDPDFGLYFSESVNDGTTWSAPTKVFTPVELPTLGADANGDVFKLYQNAGLDFFYDGENTQMIFSAYPEAIGSGKSSGTYFPSDATLLYWKTGYTAARTLISKIVDDALPASELDTAFISTFNANNNLYLTGANLSNPVIVASNTPGKWSVLFNAWANNDVQDVEEFTIGANTYNKAPYNSIWRITTRNNGVSFTNPEMILGNDETTPSESKLDYHFPQASYFNPTTNGNMDQNILFQADTTGSLPAQGYVGFNDAHFFVKKYSVASVKDNEHTYNANASLGQNFPNPMIAANKTSIPMALKNDEDVTLTVSDMLGREMMVVFSGRLSAGEHTIPVNLEKIAGGVYQYTLKTKTGQLSRLLTVVK